MPEKILEPLLDALTAEESRALLCLAAPISLTDELALQLLELGGLRDGGPLLGDLKSSGLCVTRNSEWHLETAAREVLLGLLANAPELKNEVHCSLRERCFESYGASDEDTPWYMRHLVGAAYHQAELEPESGVHLYERLEYSAQPGEYWLAGVAALEQHERGVLPPTVVEPFFLRGMYFWGEGDREAAVPFFRQLQAFNQDRIEVAVALHLLGKTQQDRAACQEMFERSLGIAEAIGADRHKAHVEHSLAICVQATDPVRARTLLEDSRAIGQADEALRAHVAKVEHTLGNLIAKQEPASGAWMLRRSLRHHEALGIGIVQEAHILDSLGHLFRRCDKWRGAEYFYRRALQLTGDPKAVTAALTGLSFVTEARGDYPSAVQYMERAISVAKRSRWVDLGQREARLRKLQRLARGLQSAD